MIGFLAGILAGLVVGPSKFTTINPNDLSALLGIAAAGYAGADFVENTYSIVFPSATSKASILRTDAPTDPSVQTLETHIRTLSDTVSSLENTLRAIPRVALFPGDISGLATALNAAAPHVNTSVWVPQISAAFKKFDMVSNKRMAAAIGQFLVEAGSAFQEVIENLRYTHADRIVKVFPKEFPTETDAQPYVNNPEALANRAYANKNGNGNEASGDGYRFRGRGLIQLTGRREYTQFGAAIGMTAERAAQYCETPEVAAMSGCWYLSSRGCLEFADTWNLSEITKRVNGSAMLGNDERIEFSNEVLQSLGG